jgi:hypothetical protein
MMCLSVMGYHVVTKIVKLFDNMEPFEATKHSLTNRILFGEFNRPRKAALSRLMGQLGPLRSGVTQSVEGTGQLCIN